MSHSLQMPARDPLIDPRNPKHFQVGTLTYTKAGLITLFLFLLWGDFCFSLMETVVPSVLPLKLNAIGAPNWALGLIVTTIPNLMNTMINPFVSFRSDRFRSKWGRRIPFLAGATPFLVIFLILLGYSEPISRWVQASVLGGKFPDLAVLLGVIAVFMVCFQFFNLFITSVYYYLFNDVVPEAFLARFMALFRMVGTAAGALYNFFVFKYANSHTQEIFLVAALLYLVAFVMMCWKVREGEYPPPPQNVGNRPGLVAAMQTYARECFGHRFYWYFFLSNAFLAMTWAGSAYSVLLATKLVGADLDLFGKVTGICGVVSLVLLYPAGMLADRFHPLRVVMFDTIFSLFIAPFSIAFYFLCHHLDTSTAVTIWITLSALGLPFGTVATAAELPMYMRLLPRERYGQFCSANALIRSLALIVAGVGSGLFLDFAKRFGETADECFRFVPIWNVFFKLLSLFFLILLYREWKRLGGLRGYQPPRPDVPDSGDPGRVPV